MEMTLYQYSVVEREAHRDTQREKVKEKIHMICG